MESKATIKVEVSQEDKKKARACYNLAEPLVSGKNKNNQALVSIAIEYLEHALMLHPNFNAAQELLNTLLQNQTETVVKCKSKFKTTPRKIAGYQEKKQPLPQTKQEQQFQAILKLFDDGDPEEAYTQLLKLIEKHPKNPIYWYSLALIRNEGLGDTKGAKKALKKTLSIDPNFEEAQKSLALLEQYSSESSEEKLKSTNLAAKLSAVESNTKDEFKIKLKPKTKLKPELLTILPKSKSKKSLNELRQIRTKKNLDKHHARLYKLHDQSLTVINKHIKRLEEELSNYQSSNGLNLNSIKKGIFYITGHKYVTYKKAKISELKQLTNKISENLMSEKYEPVISNFYSQCLQSKSLLFYASSLNTKGSRVKNLLESMKTTEDSYFLKSSKY